MKRVIQRSICINSQWFSSATSIALQAVLSNNCFVRDFLLMGGLRLICEVLRRFLWSKGKFATEEENSGPVVFEVSEASGIGLDGLDFRIDPFREGVGDVAVEIGQDVG